MVTLTRIYTRTGDKGTTALSNGERRPKYDLRIEAYGTVDEVNACIGLARQYSPSIPAMDVMLQRIQNDLFDLGADLATPDRGKPLPYEPLRIIQKQVDRLETEMDELNSELEPLRSFVLPGGSALASNLHLARTVCRRAERLAVRLFDEPEEPVSEEVVRYLNRLSDFLFVAARYANLKADGDILWVPGQNR
ncbi:cob(I)yrinic acid a,c-diamide adenosyltransferase [Microvirga sp. W0021]|uniref:Corrinoid adenosyltransferase n=1 Tax=Hohaiivirga grylli TaxID=3133970 RepID=A0ABV0BGV6_9HYPH